MHVELWPDDHTWIVAEVSVEKNKADTDRGTLHTVDFEVTSWSLLVYIDKMDYDVTAAFLQSGRESERAYFEEMILEKARKDWFSD